MYVIKANVCEEAADEVQHALVKLGVTRMHLARVNGYTCGCTREIVYRGVKQALRFNPEFELEAFAADEAVDDVVGTIIRVSRSLHGDGYVTATPVEQCYRIRTGAREL